MEKKFDCYTCKHRRSIPGDCHSMCAHPATGLKENANMFDGVVACLEASGASELGIVGNAHGIRCGWFFWPGNFDPVWLVNCNGYEFNDKQESKNVR